MSLLDPDSAEFRDAQHIAWTQKRNVRYGMPLDHLAIMRGRKVLPDHFDDLPSDEECRKALGINIESKGRK